MSIGRLKTEADVARFVDERVQQPGVVPTPAVAAIALMKAGAPADGDFPSTPGNGILAYDTEEGRLWARVNDEWNPI